MKFLILLLGISLNVQAKLSYELVKDKLDIVWGMDFNGDDLIFTERDGDIKRLNLKSKKVTTITGAPKVYARGQGGMLDIKYHPKNKEQVYFTYSKKVGDYYTTALATAKIKENQLIDLKDLLVGKGKSDTRRHFGSRITFDGQGHLFFSIGDRGDRDNPQKLSNHFGKVMRLNLDGSVPKDNPFVGKKGALPEIWSFGHRNPQGLVFDAKTKTLFEMEHGPRGGDEINVVEKGKNYGWPIISYGKEYWGPLSVGEGTHRKGMEQPLIHYVPSIAPCGLAIYRGEKYSKLKGKLISGALKLTHINVVDPNSGKETDRLFNDDNLRVRSVVVAPSDDIYFSTDGGKIFKLTNKAQ